MSKYICEPEERLRQGDILKNIEYIESAFEDNGIITVKKIIFPLGVVVSQDCDLSSEFISKKAEKISHNTYLLSTMILPIYNFEHFCEGEHLSDLGYSMEKITIIKNNKLNTKGTTLMQNKNPRYHYLEFDKDIDVVSSIIDFKHYFTVNSDYLEKIKKTNFICSMSPLYRELLSQRFSCYLSRIGLPVEKPKDELS